MAELQRENLETSSANLTSLAREPLRILVVRPDRLGDVVLSTPVLDSIKRHYSMSQLTVLVKKNVEPLLKGLSSVDQLMIFDPEGKHAGIKGFFRLYKEIRQFRFLIAVVLQSHWKIAMILFLARIRYRIGPLSKFHSYLFYNTGVRQHRSQVEMHEADYNLQLLRKMGIRVGARNVPTHIDVPEASKKAAQDWLKNLGWDSKKPLVVVHPGMGGSALNWPESHYQELIRKLIEDGRQVLITAGPSEGPLVDRIEEALGALKGKVFSYRNIAKPNGDAIDFLAGLYSFSDLVVAPSTGPLHVAVALGKRVLTFYPPIRVQSALRWGPYLSDESKASVLVPDVYCGQDFNCIGSLCNYYPCMKGLTVKQALKEVDKHLAFFSTEQK